MRKWMLLALVVLVLAVLALAVVGVQAAPPGRSALRKCYGTYWRKGCYQYDPMTGRRNVWARSLYRGQWVSLAETKSINGVMLVRRSGTQQWYRLSHFRSR